jgi:hypothetical protein
MAAAITAGPGLAQSLAVEGPERPIPEIRGGQILHAQVDGTQTTGIVSQYNETATTFDNELADDIEIPEGETWAISSVYVRGFISGPAAGVPAQLTVCPEALVLFWADSDNSPGDLVAERTVTPEGAGGEMMADFDEVVLGQGRHWFSFVCTGPGLDLGVEDRWNWFVNASEANWQAAHIRNENGGFSSGAFVNWTSFDGLGFPGDDLDFYVAGNLATSSEGGVQPMVFSLLQNSPNPFTGTTDVRFLLDDAADIVLTVYDALGRQVSRVDLGTMAPGEQVISFDASALPTGTYFYRVQSGTQMMVRKMTIVN